MSTIICIRHTVTDAISCIRSTTISCIEIVTATRHCSCARQNQLTNAQQIASLFKRTASVTPAPRLAALGWKPFNVCGQVHTIFRLVRLQRNSFPQLRHWHVLQILSPTWEVIPEDRCFIFGISQSSSQRDPRNGVGSALQHDIVREARYKGS